MNRKTNKTRSSTTPNVFVLGLVSTLSQPDLLAQKMQSEYIEEAQKLGAAESSTIRLPSHKAPCA